MVKTGSDRRAACHCCSISMLKHWAGRSWGAFPVHILSGVPFFPQKGI